MDFVKVLICSFFLSLTASCGSDDDSAPQPSNRGDSNQDQGDNDERDGQFRELNPLFFQKVVTPLSTNKSYDDPAPFVVPENISEDQELTVSFKFNSKDNNKVELIETRVGGTGTNNYCSASSMKKRLVKYNEEETEIIEDSFLFFGVEVEPNTDYAVEFIGKPGSCTSLEFSAAIWAGNESEDPRVSLECRGSSANLSGDFQLFLNTLISGSNEVFLNASEHFFGGGIFCGETVEHKSSSAESLRNNQRVLIKGELEDKNGTKYSHEMFFVFDETQKGGLTCVKDEVTTLEMEFDSCELIVRDREQFPE